MIIAKRISELEGVEGVKPMLLGFDTQDFLPVPPPPYLVTRQEYDTQTKELWIMSMGRFDTEQQARELLLEMIDWYRLQVDCTMQLISQKPVEVEIYCPQTGDSFLIGVDCLNTTACVN